MSIFAVYDSLKLEVTIISCFSTNWKGQMWLRGRSCVETQNVASRRKGKQIFINLKQIWTASLRSQRRNILRLEGKGNKSSSIWNKYGLLRFARSDAKRRGTCVRQATSRRDDTLLTVGQRPTAAADTPTPAGKVTEWRQILGRRCEPCRQMIKKPIIGLQILIFDGGGLQIRLNGVMWKHELAIWTENWAFLYFTQKTWTFLTNIEWLEYATWLAWWWRWTAPQGTPDIVSFQPWTQSIHAYNSLMVWVNTDNPTATLDVNGSIKFGNNCVPATWCNEQNAWTMMYYETNEWWQLVICANIYDSYSQSFWYHRSKVSLTISEDATQQWAPKWYVHSCYPPVPWPKPIHPNTTTLQEATALPNIGDIL